MVRLHGQALKMQKKPKHTFKADGSLTSTSIALVGFLAKPRSARDVQIRLGVTSGIAMEKLYALREAGLVALNGDTWIATGGDGEEKESNIRKS